MFLAPEQVERLIDRYERCSADGDSDAYRQLHRDVLSLPATMQIPIGEMLNPCVKGFWWAWSKLGQVSEPVIPDKLLEKVAAQGIEGVVTVRCDLVAALLFATEAGARRVRIEATVPGLRPVNEKPEPEDDDLEGE